MKRRRTHQPAPGARALPAGAERRGRLRPKLRYDLLGCGLHGHALVGTDAARLRPEDALFAREDPAGFRWYRCLRCDAWLPLAVPEAPRADTPPERDAVRLPMRGRPLRDRYVLRAIAVERAVHVLVLGALVAAVFLFAAHRQLLHQDYLRISADLQRMSGGPARPPHHGIGAEVDRLFRLPDWEVYAVGVALAAYTTILVFEMVGLWWARRWAEYLTLVEACALFPLEIYELLGGFSWVKVVSVALNVAIVAYLLLAHRLFGVRGGAAAAREAHERDSGWAGVERTTPSALRGVPAPVWPAPAPPASAAPVA